MIVQLLLEINQLLLVIIILYWLLIPFFRIYILTSQMLLQIVFQAIFYLDKQL